MMKDMRKELASGLVIFVSVALVAVAAETSAPFIAGIGAVAALATGVYQAISSPKRPNFSRNGGGSGPANGSPLVRGSKRASA
jgi:hypothetical protein